LKEGIQLPFIRFTEKATEGSYLLMTSGQASWFPDGIVGVTEKLLKELKDEFTQREIKYEKLSLKELNQNYPREVVRRVEI